MISTIKDLNLDEVTTNIEKSKNAEIIETDKKILELENLKPKNCNCDSDANTVPINISQKK